MNIDMNVCEEVDIHNMTISERIPRLVRNFSSREELLAKFRKDREESQWINLAAWCGHEGVSFNTYNWMYDELKKERTA